MKPNQFDKNISNALKIIRAIKTGKLLHVAKELNMTECNYSKYEKGDIAYTMGLLKQVAEHYKISLDLIILIANGKDLSKADLSALSDADMEVISKLKEQSFK